MDFITAGMNGAIDHHDITDLNTTDLLLAYRCLKNNLCTPNGYSLVPGKLLDFIFIAMNPALDFSGFRIKHNTQAAKSPALITH